VANVPVGMMKVYVILGRGELRLAKIKTSFTSSVVSLGLLMISSRVSSYRIKLSDEPWLSVIALSASARCALSQLS
jgi:hypothetical protein